MSRLFYFASLCICSLVVVCSGSSLQAQLPAARLSSVVPLSGNPSQELEVTIAGDNLDDANQLQFSHAGIAAQQKMLEPGPFDKQPQAAENQFVVTIAANVPAGRYEVRAAGKYGVSNPRTFFVSSVPQAAEAEPNGSQEEATQLTLPADVSGLFQGTADVDYFQFTPEKAQRIILDCYAHRADSAADCVVTAYDSTGREIASSRDFQQHDPLLDFQASAGQTYTIKLNDSAYQGGNGYAYRFTVGALPHIDYLDPPADEAGPNRLFTAYGRNLPGGQNAGITVDRRPLEKLSVKISLPGGQSVAEGMFVDPASSSVSAVAFRLKNNVGSSNPIMAGVVTVPPVQEQEPNNIAAKPQIITFPVEVMGSFSYPRDNDWYTFQAKAGDQLAIEIISARLGLGTDPNMMIERIEPPAENEILPVGTQLAYVSESEVADSGPEFYTHTGDPKHLFTVETDGWYRVLVRDRQNSLRADPRHVYRLVIRKAQPDFRLAAVPVGSYSSVLLRKGGRVGVRVIAFREDGFDGPIEVTAGGLPAGVTCENAIIGPDRSAATLMLVAASNVKTGSAKINISGSSQVDGKAVQRKAMLAAATEQLAPMRNNQPQPPSVSRLATDVVLSIAGEETEPATIVAGGGKVWETSRAGTLKIPYTRGGTFKGKFTLNASDLPANIDAPTLTINPNQNSGEYELKLKDDTPVGTYTFHFAGLAEQVDYIHNPEAATAAAARQKEVDAIAAEQAAAAKKATDAKAAADKALTDAQAAAKVAETQKQAADTAFAEAADALEVAKTQLATAQQNAATTADDATLKAAVATAEKAVADQTAKLKTATETQATAEQALADSLVVVEKTTAEQATATDAAEQATELAKLATELKAETDQRATAAADAAKPKKLNVPIVSSPITLKITPTPIELKPLAENYTVKQGEALEIPIAIERKYDFKPAINLTMGAPSGVSGLSIPGAQVPANQAAGKLMVTAAANATPGEHTFTFTATMRLNNQNLTLEQPLQLTVLEVKQPEK